MHIDKDKVYDHFKNGPTRYDEEVHCKMLIKAMTDPERGTYSAFCVEAMISESNFFNWVNNHELFGNLYGFCKMVAREIWEDEGRKVKEEFLPIGQISNRYDHWKMTGWSRFGVGKNPRIKLHLNPDDNPAKHYSQLLKQAANGDFTAAEIKQLMEAINVGLNTHQVFELQKQIDELKSDLDIVNKNTNVKNTVSNKGIAQKD
jgi:hypothetical protein